MTGFAASKGAGAGYSWAWDIRAVNARGLDLRLRIPDWIEGLDAKIRASVSKVAARGSITISLKLVRDDAAGDERIDEAALDRVLKQVGHVEQAAAEAGIALARPSASDILAARGVITAAGAETETAVLGNSVAADLPTLLAAFNAMRETEGRALRGVISDQLARIAQLVTTASAQAEDRKDQMATRLKENLARVLDNSDGADPARVAQEIAVIAVKTDVTEELDRLTAHVAAARELLSADGPVGRKLDFLAQEFNREANTLCSKSQSTELTRTGLDLKATIDQMREQVQNVE